MFLDNPLNHVWRGAVVPNTIGIHHQNRPLLTNPQTVGLGAKDVRGSSPSFRDNWSVKFQLFQSPLQVVPSLQTQLLIAALGHRLIRTNEYMPLNLVELQGLSTTGQGVAISRF